jgi:hypothetical protein
MKPEVSAGLIAFASAVITSILAHWLMFRRLRRQFAERYRTVYFEKQLASYQKLWSLLKPTSLYPGEDAIIFETDPDPQFDPANAKAFCRAITDFFFSEQGIFLSKDVRKALFDLRGALEEIGKTGSSGRRFTISRNQVQLVRDSAAQLITVMRNNLGLRNLKFKIEDLGVKRKDTWIPDPPKNPGC